ncbi:phage tail protein [Escherichia coli]
MSQAVITKAFTEWKAQQAINNQPVTLDEFIFAYIPGLDADKPIDNTETAPAVDKIVYRQVVSKSGVVNENSVVYSVTMGADVGDFDFNWIGLANKATGTLAMIIHAPTQRKIKNANGQQGNVLVRSMLMEYSGAREATEITTPAETWQIDFTARLAAMDERQRRENIDLYGAAAFFDSGYLVATTGNQFFVTKGAGYVAGLRAELPANMNITASAKPTKVWLDVSWTGTLTSEWAVQSKITVAADLADYVLGGVQHYVFAVASIDATGNVMDLRPKGTLNHQAASDALKKHEQSRNHPDASISEKGFVQLSNATNSDSETLAATPKAVKAVNENANKRVPSERKVNGKPLTEDIEITSITGNAGTATKLATARTIGGVGFDGSANINLPGVNTQGNQNTTGNAGTATKLATARTIGGVEFDGSANINLPGVNTQGNQNTTGNAATATKLHTARTINGVVFDGTKDIAISASAIGSYTKAESDARFQIIVPVSGAVGTYAFARIESGNTTINFGSTLPGSVLRATCGDGTLAGNALAGTWRCCGATWGSSWYSRNTVWIRIV